MSRSEYFGENPITTTVQASPAPTTTVFTVGSAVDFVEGQYILVEISGDFERVKIDSITGAQFTLAEPLSTAPTAGASVKSGRTLLRNTLFNDSSIYHADAISDVKAILTTAAPDNLRYQVPGLGVLRLDKASSATVDNDMVYAPDSGPGRWILELSFAGRAKFGEISTAGTVTVKSFSSNNIVKATVDCTDVTVGSTVINVDGAAKETVSTGSKTYRVFEAGSSVSIETLNTLLNVASATYDSKFVSVASQTTQPEGIFLKPDGTKMYVIGSNSFIYQYTLSTPGDVSTATYDSVSYNASARFVYRLFFSPDGTKMYLLENNFSVSDVYQYTLSTPWNVSTATYTTVFDTSPTCSGNAGIYFKPDGLAFYVVAGSADRVYQFTLGTAWDVSTASYSGNSFSHSSQTTAQSGLMFSSDGKKVYVLGGSSTIYQYRLSTAWDVSTATYDSSSLSISGQDTVQRALFMRADNLKFYTVGITNDRAYQYTIGTAFTGSAFYHVDYGAAS